MRREVVGRLLLVVTESVQTGHEEAVAQGVPVQRVGPVELDEVLVREQMVRLAVLYEPLRLLALERNLEHWQADRGRITVKDLLYQVRQVCQFSSLYVPEVIGRIRFDKPLCDCMHDHRLQGTLVVRGRLIISKPCLDL